MMPGAIHVSASVMPWTSPRPNVVNTTWTAGATATSAAAPRAATTKTALVDQPAIRA